jgi:hypothetical protein
MRAELSAAGEAWYWQAQLTRAFPSDVNRCIFQALRCASNEDAAGVRAATADIQTAADVLFKKLGQ